MKRRLLAVALLTLAPLAAMAQVAERLIDTFDASDGERNVNIYVQFRCSILYASHAPLDFGSSVTIRVRPGVDCGAVPGSTERPMLSGLSTLVKSARLEEAGPGTYELQITWTRDQHFVLAPAANARGIRLRLLDVFQGPRGSISVNEGADATSGYAINLQSDTTKFSDADLDAASKALGMPRAYLDRRAGRPRLVSNAHRPDRRTPRCGTSVSFGADQVPARLAGDRR